MPFPHDMALLAYAWYDQSLAVEFAVVANPFAWASQFSAFVDTKSVVLLLLYGDEMRPCVFILFLWY